MTDQFSTYDAAYLIGALSPEDRQAYEEHLPGCSECSKAVRQIAGIPGLLACLPDQGLLPLDDDLEFADVPDTLLPRLLDSVTQRRHRRRWMAAIGSAVAAACLAFALVVGLGMREPSALVTAEPAQVAISAASGPLTATAELTARDWGTHIRLYCKYASTSAYMPGSYRLVVIDRSGRVEQIATWNVVPDKETVVDASTSLTSKQIASIEVRTESNAVVLALTP